ncbi:MAG: hypothetical protein JSS01_13500 [Proteobacteria bacterium]|nr:hypothetical protein [Pseudomonadota bacterium]
MRRALSFVLIMLLVLRGLLGDAMAMGMAPVPPAPQPMHMTGHEAHGSHAQDAMEQHCCDATGDAHAAHPGGGCSACGICHSVLGIAVWAAAPASPSRHSLHAPRGAQFASAPAAQAIKPPIV